MSMLKLRKDYQMIKMTQFKDVDHQKEIILESFCHVHENYIREQENE